MKQKSLAKTVFLTVGVTVLTGGCAERGEVAYANPPPMVIGAPPPEEVVNEPPASPPPNSLVGITVAPEETHLYMWVPGVWVWRGGWVWEPGHWAHRPCAGAAWAPPQAVVRDGQRVWMPGCWR